MQALAALQILQCGQKAAKCSKELILFQFLSYYTMKTLGKKNLHFSIKQENNFSLCRKLLKKIPFIAQFQKHFRSIANFKMQCGPFAFALGNYDFLFAKISKCD
eukprot:TRINITY_DN4954_c0_g2_i5.p3 TRINITY_DN4954_c0_g2~~TRINITY_DN4954_c0_g2_i5.p3  ORF type:complete len:104 (+),score=8.02 TRINITY_DN4954_c0_g2_i5:174-485(+)